MSKPAVDSSRRVPGDGVHALVLAAGSASRFGSPKQLAPLAGRSLLERAVEQARRVCPDRVCVVLGANRDLIEPHVANATVVYASHWRDGMSASLRAGIGALPPTANAVLVMLCDQPAIADAQYQALVDAWQLRPGRCVAARYADALGVPAIFPRRLFRDLRNLEGDAGARAVLIKEGQRVIAVAIPQAALDVDSPQDLLDATPR